MKIAVRFAPAWRGAAAVMALLAAAHPDEARSVEAVGCWPPVEDSALADLRGGFQGADGVTVAFSIDVLGQLNGVPVAQQSLIGSPFALAAVTPQALAAALGSSSALELVLKNGANRQALQLRTVLNVSLTEMTTMRALRAQALVSSWQAIARRP